MAALSDPRRTPPASPPLELDDLLARCRRAASRTPVNNVLGRSNGHSQPLLDSRNSAYNQARPLVSQILDEQSPSLSVTGRICAEAGSAGSSVFLPEPRPGCEAPAGDSPQSSTAVHLPLLLAEGPTASDPGSALGSPIWQRPTPAQLAAPRSGSAAPGLRGRRAPGPAAIPVESSLRLSSLAPQRRASPARTRPPAGNGPALLRALQTAVCKRHAAVLAARIDWGEYYLLVLDAAHNLRGLVRRLPSGALARVCGEVSAAADVSRSARGKTLRESMFSAYLVLQGDALCVHSAPVRFTDTTVGLVI